jgi:hypothetical protein
MSRARNIKPGFFKNDLLAECNPLARILFTGLWCEADREGRLEDRPKRLKVECLPYDDCDVDELLNELVDREFITRYEVDGKKYIAVNEFLKHQNPHAREVPSSIPAPTRTKHNQGSDKAQPRQCLGDDKPQPSIGSAGLIPDSPSLIPDSLIPPSSSAGQTARPSGQTSDDDDKPVPGEQDLPSWVPRHLWREFYRHRAVIRKPLSIPGQRQVVARLVELSEQGHDIASSLRQTMAAGLAIPVVPRQAGDARAGPPRQQLGKTAQAIQALEDMKHGSRLDIGRDPDRDAETAPALARIDASR